MQGRFDIRIIFVLCALAWLVIVARAYTNVKGPDALQAVLPQSEVQRFARQQLDALQSESFASDRELCGIIFETSDGELGVSRPTSGSEASCDIAFFDEPGMVPVASFHTHGAYSAQYDGEVPSIIDIQSDIASGIDGYISTPGGRLWFVDHARGEARIVCGPGCLTQDPDYRACDAGRVADRYTVEGLQARYARAYSTC